MQVKMQLTNDATDEEFIYCTENQIMTNSNANAVVDIQKPIVGWETKKVLFYTEREEWDMIVCCIFLDATINKCVFMFTNRLTTAMKEKYAFLVGQRSTIIRR